MSRLSSLTKARLRLYCELHAHSWFSLLDGVASPEQLVAAADMAGLPALALTDHDGLYGVVPFVAAAQAAGIKPILGSELTLADGHHLTLLAENQTGYQSLSQLITLAKADQPKGQAALSWDVLHTHRAGLICLTGCRQGLVAAPWLSGQTAKALAALDRLVDLFGPQQLFVELQRHAEFRDKALGNALRSFAITRGLPLVATGNVHYTASAEAGLHDALTSIRLRVPLLQAQERKLLRANAQFYLRSPAEMAAIFADLPEAITNTAVIAERCNVTLPSGLEVLPSIPIPGGLTAGAYLRQLCIDALPQRYPHEQAEARARLENELKIIAQLHLENYFLVNRDICQFCEREGVLFHLRGAAASSIVAYLLRISKVDPIEFDLISERFVSTEHGGTPDMDMDIDAAKRERVIQYVYDHYGRDHAAMACTYVTYRQRSAMRDAAYALGIKPSTAAALEEQAQAAEDEGRTAALTRPTTLAPELWAQLTDLAQALRQRPRHLGIHNGGMIISGQLLAQVVPLEPATMDARSVVQWDKEFLELLGIVKTDLLGLRMLSAISDTLDLIKKTRGITLKLDEIGLKDIKAVLAELRKAKNIGVFQAESGAQISLMPRMQPRSFFDLLVLNSLIRPGPMLSGAVREYMRRRLGLAPVTYLHPLLEKALKPTLGVLVWQEQVIESAHEIAGFGAGQGDALRRALGHKDAAEAIERFRAAFLAGAVAQGVPHAVAHQVWQLIANFAGYSFNKAHAAAFAQITYWSAWLRLNFTAEYFCGLLRHVPLGTYPAHVLEAEARRKGVQLLPFDVNRSLAKTTVEKTRGGLAIRYGLEHIRGMSEASAEAVVQARGQQPFRSLTDFVARTAVDRGLADNIAQAGALDGLGERRTMTWGLTQAFEAARNPQLAFDLDLPNEKTMPPPFTLAQKVMKTFALTGVTASNIHLTDFRRKDFEREGCWSYRQLEALTRLAPPEQRRRLARSRGRVKAGGIVADGLRMPESANGTAFVMLDDRAGQVNVTIPPELAEAAKAVVQQGLYLVVAGRFRPNGNVISIVAESFRELSG